MGGICSTKNFNEKENVSIPIILGDSIGEETSEDLNFFEWYNIYITDIGKIPPAISNNNQEWQTDVNNNYFVGIDRQVFYTKLNYDLYPTSANEVSLIVTQVNPQKLKSNQIYNICLKKNKKNIWFMHRTDINFKN